MSQIEITVGLIAVIALLTAVVGYAIWKHEPAAGEEWGDDWAP